MRTKLIILSLLCLLFVQCAKDEETLIQEPAIAQNEEPASLSRERTIYTCPLTDYSCTSINTTLDDMTGDYFHPSSGKLDKAINCMMASPTYCDRACATQTVSHMYDVGGNFLGLWSDGGEPCAPSGIYTAQAQQNLIDKIKQVAVDQAPLCQNRKMIPYKYDVSWTVITSPPPVYYIILAEVSYISRCNPGPYMPMSGL